MRARNTSFLLAVSSPILLLVGGAILALLFTASPSDVLRELAQDAVRQAVLLSLRTTAVSLVIIAVCGTPLALLIYRRVRFLSAALEFLITLPAILPPSVAGLALLLAFGNRGLIGSFLAQHGIHLAFTTGAVIMAQTFVATPFFVREASDAFKSIEPSILDSARLDGASAAQLLGRIMLPTSSPFLLTGVILAWARALSEFGATILFAGSLQGVTQTLPIAIYIGWETNLNQAKDIAVLLLLIAAVTLLMLRVLLRRSFVYAH